MAAGRLLGDIWDPDAGSKTVGYATLNTIESTSAQRQTSDLPLEGQDGREVEELLRAPEKGWQPAAIQEERTCI